MSNAIPWADICDRAELQNLPYKIETDEHGKIIMTPTKLYHGYYQAEIVTLLNAQSTEGAVISECAVWTPSGTKVADVAWLDDATFATVKGQAEASIAPQVCVEVLSDSNTAAELSSKRELYFAQGALEFWICGQDGAMTFYTCEGQSNNSVCFPDFPTSIE